MEKGTAYLSILKPLFVMEDCLTTLTSTKCPTAATTSPGDLASLPALCSLKFIYYSTADLCCGLRKRRWQEPCTCLQKPLTVTCQLARKHVGSPLSEAYLLFFPRAHVQTQQSTTGDLSHQRISESKQKMPLPGAVYLSTAKLQQPNQCSLAGLFIIDQLHRRWLHYRSDSFGFPPKRYQI